MTKTRAQIQEEATKKLNESLSKKKNEKMAYVHSFDLPKPKAEPKPKGNKK